jgi:hypothetical protein
MGLTSPNRTINQIWADTIPIEQLLFKRRPRFTSSKILFDPFSWPDRKKISEQSESISSNQPTFQKSFLKIVESLLAGALCDNSRNNFFKVLMKCSKKIFVEWKKTEAFGSRHTPHLITKNILRDQTSARIAVRRIARSNRTLFKKILNTIRSERRYEVAFRKVRNQKNFFQKNKISKSDARSEARRTHLGCQTIDPKRLEKIRPKGSGQLLLKSRVRNVL